MWFESARGRLLSSLVQFVQSTLNSIVIVLSSLYAFLLIAGRLLQLYHVPYGQEPGTVAYLRIVKV
jgi:hypothetical protein